MPERGPRSPMRTPSLHLPLRADLLRLRLAVLLVESLAPFCILRSWLRRPYALIGLWSALLRIAETVVGGAPYQVSFAGPKELSHGLSSQEYMSLNERAIERHIGVARL